MADERMYILQPSFAAGEISPDVASRVDIDKYQSALLQAKNAFIRPYGSAYRRPGTVYAATLASGAHRLKEFAVSASLSYLLDFREGYVDIYSDESDSLVLKGTVATPFAGTELRNLRFAQSADVMFIASGSHPVQVLTRHGDTSWTMGEFTASPPYFDALTMPDGVTLTPSGTGGNVTLTASGSAFSPGQVGNWVQIKQDVPAQTVTLTATGTSSSMLAGAKGWKVISHGTWEGNFEVQYSHDNANWKTLRHYSSQDDFNVTETGTFEQPVYIRLSATITSGTFSADLTRLPYTHKGTAKITAYTDAAHVTALVQEQLAGTMASDEWAFGAWSDVYGYPSCVAFFQDRLCLAANTYYPYMVWMSRTSDYWNFGTEEVEGTLTDDSAVAISFISRRDYAIKHLIAQSDLIIMTEGNEWIISGNSTVKPTEVNPQMQTSRGCTDVVPELIGGQMIYVQRHGKTVRDMQYNYATDTYDGADLTILSKHIFKDTVITDAAYKQEPDYMIFFVLGDGTCACLTYINEQKVYAWSRMETDGKVLAVEVIDDDDGERVYFVVNRDGQNYMERLGNVFLDCAKTEQLQTQTDTLTAAWLANKTVDVLADGKSIKRLLADETGTVKLDVPCTEYVMGLSYETIMELPNIELQLRDGTMQGRKKKVSEVILRLQDSLGGRIGARQDKTDVIKYDELQDQDVTMFSGEKRVTVPNVSVGGFNDWGRVVIQSDDPYPLSVSSIVRVVVPGG